MRMFKWTVGPNLLKALVNGRHDKPITFFELKYLKGYIIYYCSYNEIDRRRCHSAIVLEIN